MHVLQNVTLKINVSTYLLLKKNQLSHVINSNYDLRNWQQLNESNRRR